MLFVEGYINLMLNWWSGANIYNITTTTKPEQLNRREVKKVCEEKTEHLEVFQTQPFQ